MESIQEEQLLPQSPLTSSPSSRSLLTHILAEALALKCCQNGLFRCEGREQTPQHNLEWRKSQAELNPSRALSVRNELLKELMGWELSQLTEDRRGERGGWAVMFPGLRKVTIASIPTGVHLLWFCIGEEPLVATNKWDSSFGWWDLTSSQHWIFC